MDITQQYPESQPAGAYPYAANADPYPYPVDTGYTNGKALPQAIAYTGFAYGRDPEKGYVSGVAPHESTSQHPGQREGAGPGTGKGVGSWRYFGAGAGLGLACGPFALLALCFWTAVTSESASRRRFIQGVIVGIIAGFGFVFFIIHSVIAGSIFGYSFLVG